MRNTRLVFLKLGGSLITDKTKPMTPRPEVIQQLADEVAIAYQEDPNLRLLIGHGSGSFGHAVANQYQTHSGGSDQTYWQGFSKVWSAARALNQMVINALIQSGLPAIAFPPSSGVISHQRTVKSWDITPIQLALSNGLLPVVQGDVTFDEELGGTILSTEAVFQYLARELKPQEILIAGLEEGVLRQYPTSTSANQIISSITPENYDKLYPALAASQAVDVTGGMLSKVEMMINLIKENPQLSVRIFSGVAPNNLYRSLKGNPLGTLITNTPNSD